MKKFFKKSALLLTAGLVGVSSVYAGNPQRVGSAGAPELLINPWARSTGWFNLNTAMVTGVEGMTINVAGLAHTKKTELMFANTQWLVGTDLSINAFGFAQKVGANGTIGFYVSSFDYGEWEITTTELPEGGAGTISPSALNLGLSYAQKFTDNIFGGVTLKVFNQGINNLNATALCVDAGVQYWTGDRKQWKFGITLKNIGPGFSYAGDGFSISVAVPQGGYTQAAEQRSAEFELPSQLTMGGSYDFKFTGDMRLTLGANFISNSFQKDSYALGAEFGFKEYLQVRAAYRLEDNRVDDIRTSAYTGLAAGISLQAPLSKNNSNVIGLDYSYRPSDPFSGTHAIGLRFNL